MDGAAEIVGRTRTHTVTQIVGADEAVVGLLSLDPCREQHRVGAQLGQISVSMTKDAHDRIVAAISKVVGVSVGRPSGRFFQWLMRQCADALQDTR